MLGWQVTTHCRPPLAEQRSALWFHLADFEPFISHIEMSMRCPLSYDVWYTTHHVMGHGNWVWGIPLQSSAYERLMSIGLVYRPDIFPHPMRSIDDFLAYTDREHPALADMVRSGKVLHSHAYHKYVYWAGISIHLTAGF